LALPPVSDQQLVRGRRQAWGRQQAWGQVEARARVWERLGTARAQEQPRDPVLDSALRLAAARAWQVRSQRTRPVAGPAWGSPWPDRRMRPVEPRRSWRRHEDDAPQAPRLLMMRT
jgi:hypothetical protein